MPSCVLRFCKNYTAKINKSSGITFHRFPKDKLLKQKWIEFIRFERSEMDWMPNTYSRICSDHFTKEAFYKTKKGFSKVNKNARPRIKRLHARAPLVEDQSSESESASSTQNALESGDSHSDRESTPTSSLHTVVDIPTEEYTIKVENESDHDEENDGSCDGVDVSLETANQRKRDGSSGGAEVPLVPMGDRMRNYNYIGDVSTVTVNDLVKQLQVLTQGDSYDNFGRYVASALRSMPAQRARDLQPRIVEILVCGGGGDGH